MIFSKLNYPRVILPQEFIRRLSDDSDARAVDMEYSEISGQSAVQFTRSKKSVTHQPVGGTEERFFSQVEKTEPNEFGRAWTSHGEHD